MRTKLSAFRSNEPAESAKSQSWEASIARLTFGSTPNGWQPTRFRLLRCGTLCSVKTQMCRAEMSRLESANWSYAR